MSQNPDDVADGHFYRNGGESYRWMRTNQPKLLCTKGDNTIEQCATIMCGRPALGIGE
jgi:hypothetical protein